MTRKTMKIKHRDRVLKGGLPTQDILLVRARGYPKGPRVLRRDSWQTLKQAEKPKQAEILAC